jgi:hypothetical protein
MWPLAGDSYAWMRPLALVPYLLSSSYQTVVHLLRCPAAQGRLLMNELGLGLERTAQ